jgi:hypothetical protein
MIINGCVDQDKNPMVFDEFNKLWERLQRLEENQAQLRTWGVIVYDIGMCFVHAPEQMY